MKLQDIFTDRNFLNITEAILKMHGIGTHYARDIRSETALVIAEKIELGNINLDDIQNPSRFYFGYCRLVILNRDIQKRYGFNNVEYIENLHNVNNPYEKSKYDKADEFLEPSESDTWSDDYKKKLFKIYLETPSYRKISKRYKIPVQSIMEKVNEVKFDLIINNTPIKIIKP